MSNELKEIVTKEDTFDRLDIRLGRIVSVEPARGTAKPSYLIRADFGRFGVRTSVGRFTCHSTDELEGAFILGVLNFETRSIGEHESQFLCLGVQFPKAESGEATIISPLAPAKIGSKMF